MTVRRFSMGKAGPPSRARRTKGAESTPLVAAAPIKAKRPVAGTMSSSKTVAYPDWAPKELCEIHARCVVSPSTLAEAFEYEPYFDVDPAEAIPTLHALVADDRMQAVWKALRRLDHSAIPQWEKTFVLFCLYLPWKYASTPKVTTGQKKRRLKRIAELARNLGTALENAPSARIRDARAHELTGWTGKTPLAQMALPPIRQLAFRLAEMADQEALIGSPITQPGAPSARQNYFTGAIRDYFRRYYGRPFTEHVAVVAEVVLRLEESTIDHGAVHQQDRRKLIRTKRQRSLKK